MLRFRPVDVPNGNPEYMAYHFKRADECFFVYKHGEVEGYSLGSNINYYLTEEEIVACKIWANTKFADMPVYEFLNSLFDN